MGDPVVHFEIVGKDAAALRTFYGEAFGWAIGEPAAGINVQDYAYVHPNDRVGVDGADHSPHRLPRVRRARRQIGAVEEDSVVAREERLFVGEDAQAIANEARVGE